MDVVRAKFVDNDVQQQQQHAGEERWIGTIEDYLATRDLIGKVLAETDPFMQFLLEPMQFDDEEERVRTSRFLMGFPISDDMRQGGAVSLGCRPKLSNRAKKEEENTTTPTPLPPPLAACLLVRTYDPVKKEQSKSSILLSSVSSFWSSGMAYYRIISKEHIPPLFSSRKKRPHMYHFFRVAVAISKATDVWHAQYGPSEPHWHICQVGGINEDVTAQLLERLVRIADEEQMAIYMESSGEDDQLRLYERIGFQRVATEEFVDPDDDTRKITIGCFVRQPVTPKH